MLTPTEARDSVDLDVIVVIAASFGLGQAIEVSGLADTLADTLIEPFGASATWACCSACSSRRSWSRR